MDKFITSFPAPLELGDSIKDWKYTDVTQVLGRQYTDIDLGAVLSSENADQQLRDLAITSKIPTRHDLKMLTVCSFPTWAGNLQKPVFVS